jgi:RNA polymerase sigma factor
LILQYRPFIIRVASRVCKRQINWNDDEASISLLAFNEAIDRFDPKQGKTFDNFCQVMMQHRLIDEFRKNSKHSKTEFFSHRGDEELELSAAEIASSLSTYEREESATELANELQLFDQALQEYGINLEELEDCSPNHRDTRIQLIRMAKTFSNHPSLVNHLHKTKQLPLKEMLQYVEVSRKTLERNRKYLISLILIYSSDEFSLIRNTVSFTDVGE